MFIVTHYILGIVSAILIVLTAPIATSQEIDDVVEVPVLPDEAYEVFSDAPAGTVSCFDHYTFNSVQTSLRPQIGQAVSGASITFSGTIKNNNPYPVVDGSLFVKIFKYRTFEKDTHGPDVVDEFFVIKDVSIDAYSEIPIRFSWDIPAHATTGNYAAATFFSTSRKFNLLGLPFTDDVIGERILFTVSGESSGAVMFAKDSVRVAGNQYFFAAFPPRVKSSEVVPVSARVTNTTNKPQKASITWTVYYWDAQLRENIIDETTQAVVVPANSESAITVSVTNTDYPVYYVVGKLKWKDTKSIVGIRFVRDGVDRPRINFPGIDQFPLVAGKKTNLFACLHNTGDTPLLKEGSLEIILSDKDWNPIAEYSYKGSVTGEMVGISKEFTPRQSYDYVQLDARMYHKGVFVDEANLIYDCKKINPVRCSDNNVYGFTTRMSDTLSASNIITLVSFVGLVLIVIALAIFYKKWFT